ncbi:GntR family transcriptional regulator [Tritonibacter scottomollicae]|uniref:GntR family transcriptional regulator n=1 Tax=Tritonibacter scottomollicae TaxID=483013 RepID=A0ABZ0HG57_TRISK|nr:GntR family transcriptional regulator [Tritonibacter scottomollicae]WOI33476.1 GntR family transcriptional regulator [Tritonibacter scottomollicae]
MRTMTSDKVTGKEELPRTERALQEIRRDILSMAFAPGEPVSERALEERYGMSRTPIRAALAALIGEGLIVRDPRRGYMIAPIDLQEIHDLFEFREELEDTAVRLACRRARPEDLDALRRTVERGRTDFEVEDWMASGLDVHVELAALSGNPFLRDAVHAAVGRALRLRWLLASDKTQRDAAFKEHSEILDLVAAGDEDEAARKIRLHTQAVRDQILAAVEGARRFLGTRGVVDQTSAQARNDTDA